MKILVNQVGGDSIVKEVTKQKDIFEVIAGIPSLVQVAGKVFIVCNSSLNQSMTDKSDNVSIVFNDLHIKGDSVICRFNGMFFEGLSDKEIKKFI